MIHWNLLSLAVAICAAVAPGASQLTPKETVSKITRDQDIFQVVQSIEASPDEFRDYVVNEDDHKTLLMLAAQYGRSTVVNALLQAGANVNALDTRSQTALIWAIKDNSDTSATVVTALLDGGADVSLPRAPLWSPLHHAAQLSSSSVITPILQKNPDVNRADANGKTPLMVAADYLNNVLQLLIDAGADVNRIDDIGYTALMRALNPSTYGTIDEKNVMCDVLLNAAADPNLPVPPLLGPLDLAAMRGETYIIKKLIDAGANVNRTDHEGKTPLLLAAENGQTVLDILIDAGANVDHQDYSGNTAMTYNIKKNALFQIHEALVSAGANIELPAAPAWGPLHLAVDEQADTITKALIADNADVNRQDYRGITPLIVAANEGRPVISELVEAGADINHMDIFGYTALTRLIKSFNGPEERRNLILRQLLAANASVLIPEAPANSPLHWAAERGYLYVAKSLVDAGAEVNRLNHEGRSPLILSAVHSKAVMQPMIDAGADADVVDYDGKTALLYTIDRYYPTSSYANSILSNLDSLMSINASVKLPEEPFTSPLHYAVTKESKYIIEKILEAGAAVDREDTNGDTPLISAVEKGNTLIDPLISADANVNHINNAGLTPIMALCRSTNNGDLKALTILDTLLKAGGDPNLKLGESQSALHYAASKGYGDLIKMLVANGASLTAIDSQGYTPLMMTSRLSNALGPMKLLLDSGSDVNGLSYFHGTLIHRLVLRRDAESLGYAMKFCPNLLLMDDRGRTPLELANRNSYSEIADILEEDQDSLCVYQMQVYEAGQYRCEYNTAYICNGDCGWAKVPLENTNCSSSGCDFTCSPGTDPVCGSNGIIYASECLLDKAACIDPTITLAHRGNCVAGGCDVTCSPGAEDPVCGSNGITYATQCQLDKAACVDPTITLAHKGNCDSCYMVCPTIYEPVCGSDGTTYPNMCGLHVADCRNPGVTKAHDGPCDGTPDPCNKPCPTISKPVCGSDGTTYPNECGLNIAKCRYPGLKKAHDGPCKSGAAADPSRGKGLDRHVNVYVNVY